eukprot:CAMPEP_0176122332 /NCGR_PEP_ID=MMETSP0120_2-20121206/61609_1 /TAXON_ID=160619 /ORGANISM="Kryptoperidinium foliaceum, Strain CCMP 1326" /LENGTH=147 /DNA_ID=CAMNT_0017456951 /DNA_START=19 /DNA_END=458 /DNA_ORIENTATION=-
MARTVATARSPASASPSSASTAGQEQQPPKSPRPQRQQQPAIRQQPQQSARQAANDGASRSAEIAPSSAWRAEPFVPIVPHVASAGEQKQCARVDLTLGEVDDVREDTDLCNDSDDQFEGPLALDGLQADLERIWDEDSAQGASGLA